jgi:hypothetical protein
MFNNLIYLRESKLIVLIAGHAIKAIKRTNHLTNQMIQRSDDF